MALVKHDPRLLFFQVLDHGTRQGVIKDFFIQSLEKECGEMGLKYAEKYYSVIYPAYLRQSLCIVLGVMNLGLLKESGGDLEKALSLIISRKAQGLFRVGWTHIGELSKIVLLSKERWEIDIDFGTGVHTLDDIQREIAAQLAAESGKSWLGMNDYEVIRRKYSFLIQKRKFFEWMVDTSYRVDQEEEDELSMSDEAMVRAELLKIRAATIFLSFYLDKDPYGPIISKDVGTILERIKTDPKGRFFKQKTRRFVLNVPERFKKVFSVCAKEFLEDNVGELKRLLIGEKTAEALTDLDNPSLYRVVGHVGVYDQEKIQEVKRTLLVFERSDLPSLLRGEAGFKVDINYRLVVLERLCKEGTLNAEEIATIITYVPAEEWVGKIVWYEVPWDVIGEVLEELDEIDAGAFLCHLFQYGYDAKRKESWQWWKEIPLFWADQMLLAIAPKDRLILSQRVKLSVSRIAEYVRETSRLSLLVLAPPKDWYWVWMRLEVRFSGNLLSIFGDLECFGWTVEEREKYLLRIALAVSTQWKQSKELDQNSSPFWAPGLREELKKILNKEEFDRITQELETKHKIRK